jgi:hypothetical protein
LSGRLAVRPFIEGTVGHLQAVGGGLFSPSSFYGTDRLSALSIGMRVEWRMAGHRMGRYGELLGTQQGDAAGVHHHP